MCGACERGQGKDCKRKSKAVELIMASKHGKDQRVNQRHMMKNSRPPSWTLVGDGLSREKLQKVRLVMLQVEKSEL